MSDKPETVYAHVERTVHGLLDAIVLLTPKSSDIATADVHTERIKMLAEAVRALCLMFCPTNGRALQEPA